MKIAFRFDDTKPAIGSTVYAFRTLSGLKDFAKMQGDKGTYKFWEIEGTIVSDDGGIDGIQILVNSAKEVF